jgi:AcrR family transcriptional regulator
MPAKSLSPDVLSPRRPRGRPKLDDLAALEARLIHVGREHFFRHGYGATSMTAIATAANVSKTTLYKRFPSKAALFQGIVARQVADWDTGLHHTPIPDFDTLEETLRAYGIVLLRAGMTADFVQLNRLIHSESGRFPELGAVAGARFKLGAQTLSNYIRTFAVREGIPCNDPDYVAELFLLMSVGWCITMVIRNQVVTASERDAWLDKTIRIFLASRPAW